MQIQRYIPFASWFVGCVIISCLVSIATPVSDVWSHLLTAVTSGVVGMIMLARYGVSQLGTPANVVHCVHHYPECGSSMYSGPDDDGYDGWMGSDRPRPPSYPPPPPSRN